MSPSTSWFKALSRKVPGQQARPPSPVPDIRSSRRFALSFVATLAGAALVGCPQPPAPPETVLLNDTGITACASGEESGLPCADSGSGTDAYPGQDAEYGRDATANDDSDGHAGFSFTKLGADGQALAIQDAAWSDDGSEAAGTKWSCARDEVTGLTWEVKLNDRFSLHHKDHTYSWYDPNPSTNGRNAGSSGGGSCNGTLPVSGGYTGCDTYTFPRYVNENGGLCGYTNWRMPDPEELYSTVDYNRNYTDPTIDTGYFPNTAGELFWSATPYAYPYTYPPCIGYFCPDAAWCVGFSTGYVAFCGKSDSLRVRLVRGAQ